MQDFEIVKNQSLVTTRQEVYPSFADGVQIAAVGANAEGNKVAIVATTTNTVNTWTITHAADASGSIVVNLDGVNYTVAITAGSIASVASQIRASYFGAWVVTGADAEVIFTRAGRRITSTFLDVGTVTKVTATIVSTNAGVGIGDDFQITSIAPTTLSAIGTYQITLYKGASGSEERIGSARFAIATAVGLLPTIPVTVPKLPAGTRVSATLASVAGGSETMKISLGYDG